MSEPSDDYRPRCRNLCCKSMMVFGENFESDPDYVPGVTDFWCVLTSKGHGPDGEHVLAPNELVLSVSFQVLEGQKNAIYEVRHKQSYDWPVAAAAVAFKLDDDKARNVKVVLGHVAPTPVIATEAARALEGQTVNEGAATEAGSNAARGAKPLAQNHYKVKLVEVAVKRAVLTAAGHNRYWEV